MNDFKDITETFKDHMWAPEDYTKCFYYQYGSSELIWSESYEEIEDVEKWEDCYSSDRVREIVEIGDYWIATLDDGYGGQYQAIFDKRKEVKSE